MIYLISVISIVLTLVAVLPSSWSCGKNLICSDADAFYFCIWQESVSNNFGYIDCSADGSAACFYADFFCSAVEECDACEDIVHYWFFAD